MAAKKIAIDKSVKLLAEQSIVCGNCEISSAEAPLYTCTFRNCCKAGESFCVVNGCGPTSHTMKDHKFNQTSWFRLGLQ